MVAIGNADILAFDKVVKNPFLGLAVPISTSCCLLLAYCLSQILILFLLRISCCPGLEEERTREKVEERRRKNRKKRDNVTKGMQHKEDRDDSI
jgi:hypothetical protein